MLKLNQTPTFVAIWKHTIYSITFNENGGQDVSDLTGIFDSTISLPNTSKAGYDFIGWFSSAELAETANQADIVSISKMPDTNTTLFAGWIIRSNKLFIYKNNLSETIELNVQFGSIISAIDELNPSSFSKTLKIELLTLTSSSVTSLTILSNLS